MAEDFDTGRHRNEGLDEQPPSPASAAAPPPPVAPASELPGPPAVVSANAVAPRQQPPPRPAASRYGRGDQGLWDRPNGADPQQQWGGSPQQEQQWGVPAQRPIAAAPRRGEGQQVRPSANQSNYGEYDSASTRCEQAAGRPEPEQRRMSAPRPSPAAREAIEPDHYRRAGAPMQTAYTGIRDELIAVSGEERTAVATMGWRGAVNAMGLKLAPGKRENVRREVLRRIRARKDAMYSIAVLTLKGGAGKTTVTAALGQVFSSVRGDGVVAIDADPAGGDLADRTATHPEKLSMVELLETPDLSQRDFVQRFMSTTDADLQVLSNGWRPDSDRVIDPQDIVDIHEIASHYYSMLLWDGDTALHSATVRQMLNKSNALVLLVEASPPGARNAGQTIDWLRSHGFEGLLARTVVVVNETTADTRLDLKALLAVLARQQIKLHRIPFDRHLSEGMEVDLAKLKKSTREAFEDLAAMLADDFVIPQPPAHAAALN